MVQIPKTRLIYFSIRASYLDNKKILRFVELYPKTIYIKNNLNLYLKDINNRIETKSKKLIINLNNIKNVVFHAKIKNQNN